MVSGRKTSETEVYFSPCLFITYTEAIMRKIGFDEVNIHGLKIRYLCYAADIVFLLHSLETGHLNFIEWVKHHSEKKDPYLNVKKMSYENILSKSNL